MYGEQRHGEMPKSNILEHEQLWDVARELAEPTTSHWLNLITSS